MEAYGFGDLRTVELLGREFDVEARDLQTSLDVEQPKLAKGWQRQAKEKAKRKRTGVQAGGEEEGGGGAGGVAGAPARVVMAHPRQKAQSHTGYLTFARLIPYDASASAAPRPAKVANKAPTRVHKSGGGGAGGGGAAAAGAAPEENDAEFSD